MRTAIFPNPRLATLAVAFASVLAMAFPWTGPAAAAQDDGDAAGHAHDVTNVWAVARGGQLYDNWMLVLEADKPKRTHAQWPASNTKKKGATTWRCKSCHGWDYKGKDGAYASGSYKTGIKGVRALVGVESAKIHKIIMDKTHGYTKQMIPHSAMEKIALFLSRGQLDTDRYIDMTSKRALGNPRRGAAIFQTICAVCHGFDGREMNFGSGKKPEFVGTVCRKNPWEGLHKIRFGQPGVGMVALAALDIETVVDILAYCQTLPPK